MLQTYHWSKRTDSERINCTAGGGKKKGLGEEKEKKKEERKRKKEEEEEAIRRKKAEKEESRRKPRNVKGQRKGKPGSQENVQVSLQHRHERSQLHARDLSPRLQTQTPAQSLMRL